MRLIITLVSFCLFLGFGACAVHELAGMLFANDGASMANAMAFGIVSACAFFVPVLILSAETYPAREQAQKFEESLELQARSTVEVGP